MRGKEKFRRHTSKCGTSTYNNGELAFSDRTLDSQFFQTFFCCRRVAVTGCPDGAAAKRARALGVPPYPSYDDVDGVQ